MQILSSQSNLEDTDFICLAYYQALVAVEQTDISVDVAVEAVQEIKAS
jgi:hypothetical protein